MKNQLTTNEKAAYAKTDWAKQYRESKNSIRRLHRSYLKRVGVACLKIKHAQPAEIDDAIKALSEALSGVAVRSEVVLAEKLNAKLPRAPAAPSRTRL